MLYRIYDSLYLWRFHFFDNNVDTPREINNNFILNQKPDFYITEMLKLMDDTFTSLPKVFVDDMIKKRINSHIKVLAQLSKFIKLNKENQQTEPMYIARDKWMNILSYVDS